MKAYRNDGLAIGMVALLALMGAAAPALAQNDARPDTGKHEEADVRSDDHVVIVRKRKGSGIETVTREVLSWDDYVAIYLDGVDPDEAGDVGILTEFDDFAETVVPTPPPPSTTGFNPGDEAKLVRSADFEGETWTRTTQYERRDGSDGGGDWIMTSNFVVRKPIASQNDCPPVCTNPT